MSKAKGKTNLPTNAPMVETPSMELINGNGGSSCVQAFAQQATQSMYQNLGNAFRDCYVKGKDFGAWDGIEGLAEFLNVHISFAKKLVTAHEHPDRIMDKKYEELNRCARSLGISVDQHLSNAKSSETLIFTHVVNGLYALRRSKANAYLPDAEVQNVYDIMLHYAVVDEIVLNNNHAFNEWCLRAMHELRTECPKTLYHIDFNGFSDNRLQTMLYAVLDWFAGRQFLPVFLEQLLHIAQNLHEQASADTKTLQEYAGELSRGWVQILALKKAMQDTSQPNTNEGLKKKLDLQTFVEPTMIFQAIGLKQDDFLNPENGLGRLMMLSDRLRPLVKKLLSFHGTQMLNQRHS